MITPEEWLWIEDPEEINAMPLVTNLCKKHKNAFPETDCPFCVLELRQSQLNASRAFFEAHGRHKIEVVPGHVVRIEDLYQHIRARLLEELNPIIEQVERKQRHES